MTRILIIGIVFMAGAGMVYGQFTPPSSKYTVDYCRKQDSERKAFDQGYETGENTGKNGVLLVCQREVQLSSMQEWQHTWHRLNSETEKKKSQSLSCQETGFQQGLVDGRISGGKSCESIVAGNQRKESMGFDRVPAASKNKSKISD